MIGYQTGFGQIGCSFKSNGKGMQTGPPGTRLAIILNSVFRVAFGDGRYHARVEASAEEHPVGHVTHELSLDSRAQGLPDVFAARGIVLHGIVSEPVAHVITFQAGFAAPIIMAGKERLVAVALSLERLQFGGHIDCAVVVVADVEGNDADGVAGNKELVALLVIERKSEDTAQVFEEINSLLSIEGEDDLAVAARLEVIAPGKFAPDILMVVYLAVDRQYLTAVG